MSISYTTNTLLKDGKPWMPTMGEMQYSRTDRRHWKEHLYRMKAGGIDIVSSYIFWNHHEEIEGHYDFNGNKNLRHFLRLVKDCGLYMFLRVGPWVHGESRNGGFPDWLVEKEMGLRCNDERYLATVERYFKKLYEQADGYMYKQGGPVIGIQVENEYGHVGGLRGEEGTKHMLALEEMLKKIGFDAPLYTATGWGDARTGNCIPVWGGYCDEPWTPGYEPTKPNLNYVFSSNLNDAQIASDYGVKDVFSTVVGKYPYLTAEIGGGIHATQKRRPIATAYDLGALGMVKLGSGANLLGYYIYCGGKNPKGILTGLQEYDNPVVKKRVEGNKWVLPELDYDFQAPLSSWGVVKHSYKELKKLAMFTRDFGELLSPMPASFPNSNTADPTDMETLRYTIRSNGDSGFLFVNNYQRRYVMTDKFIDELKVSLESGTVVFTNLCIKDKEYFIYPFNMKIGDALLKTAKAQPLCILNEKTYVFFTDKDPEYKIEGDLGDYEIVTISSKDAENAYKIHTDQDYLFISDSTVALTDKGIWLTGESDPSFKVYPDFRNGYNQIENNGVFTVYKNEIEKKIIKTGFHKVNSGYKINISYPDNVRNEDIILCIDYIGDKGLLYIDGELVMDQYCNGNCLKVNLNDMSFPTELDFVITPLYENDPVYMEVPIEFREGRAAEVLKVTAEVQYHNKLLV